MENIGRMKLGTVCMRFSGASTSEIIGARNEIFLMIMMTNDIWGWMGPKVFPGIYLNVGENLQKHLN